MATLTSKLIVELLDRATGPSRAIASSIQRLTNASRANAARLEEMRGRMIGAVGAGYALYRGLSAPIHAAKDFQTMLTDIEQKSGVSGQALKDLGAQLRGIAAATNQLPSDTIKTFDALMGLGLGGKTDAENVAAALKLLPAINKTATAFRASSEDVMKSGQAVFSNFKVPAEEVLKAFDAMASAGNAGAFELKDMATYFPELTAAGRDLGYRGVTGVSDLAAALQVVRQGAADASSAATNLKDLFGQMQSPRLAKRFEQFGLNLRGTLDAARKQGKSPLEAIVALTQKALKKGASLGDLFGNQESRMAMSALLADMERYRKIRDEARDASGLIDKEYERRIKDADAAIIRFRASIENLNIELGAGLLPQLTSIIDNGIVPMVRAISDVIKANPKLASTLISASAGLIGLQVASTAARFAFLWFKGGVIGAAIKGLTAVGRATLTAGKAFKALRAATLGASMLGAVGGGGIMSGIVGGVGTAVAAILGLAGSLAAGIAAITAPVWGIIAAVGIAVGGLALAVYKYWVPISNFVAGFASVIFEALSDLASQIAAFGGRIASAVGSWATQKLIDFGEWLGIDEATMRQALDFAVSSLSQSASMIVDVIKAIPAAVGGWIADIFTMNTYSDEATAGFRTAGENAGKALVDAIKSAIDGLIGWFKALPSRIMAAIGRIDLSKIVKLPSLPSWMGGSTAPAVAGARAAGGPVSRGKTYLVGERGPELFTAPSGGRIADTMETVRAIKSQALAGAAKVAGSTANNTFNFTINAAPGQSPEDVARAVHRELSRKMNELSHGAHSDGAY